MSERFESELKKWNDTYIIPLEDEFNVKTLLELQEEYEKVPKESNTTKTRETLLHMINNEKGYLRNLNKRREYKDYTILILVNEKNEIPKYYNIFLDMFEGYINHVFPNNNNILLNNGKKIIFVNKNDIPQGQRINEYINLTGDNKYEEVLRHMILARNFSVESEK